MSKSEILDRLQAANPGSVRSGGLLLAAPTHPALAWNVDVELHPDGYFCAVDLDVVDSVGEDGRYPAGYGRTPLAAIVELLDEMGGVI